MDRRSGVDPDPETATPVPPADASAASPDPPLPRAMFAAATVFGMTAYAMQSIAPILLAAMVEAGRLTNRSLGQVATSETLALALGATLAPSFLRRGAVRGQATAAAAVYVMLNLACFWAGSKGPLLALRAACGLSEGWLIAAAVMIIVRSRQPERMNAYFLAATFAPSILFTYLLSGLAIPRFGPNAGFLVLIALGLGAAFAARFISDEVIPSRPPGRAPRVWSGWTITALAVVFVHCSGLGAAYSYLGQMGHQIGAPHDKVGLALAGLLMFAVTASLLIGWIGWRLGHVLMLTVGVTLQAATVFVLSGQNTALVFILASFTLGFLWNSVAPFNMKLLISLDPTRRAVLLLVPVTLCGLGTGPFLASLMVRGSDVAPALRMAAGLLACVGLLHALLSALRHRKGA